MCRVVMIGLHRTQLEALRVEQRPKKPLFEHLDDLASYSPEAKLPPILFSRTSCQIGAQVGNDLRRPRQALRSGADRSPRKQEPTKDTSSSRPGV